MIRHNSVTYMYTYNQSERALYDLNIFQKHAPAQKRNVYIHNQEDRQKKNNIIKG